MTTDPIPSGLTHPFAESVRAARRAQADGPAAAAPTGSAEAIPSSPPPEIFSAMLDAARAGDRLAASGRCLHFSTDTPAGLSITLTDLNGTVLGTVAPSTVLRIASESDPD
jgi:hypothetical protein